MDLETVEHELCGFFGDFARFHSPEDWANSTSPSVLERAGQAIAAAMERAEAAGRG